MSIACFFTFFYQNVAPTELVIGVLVVPHTFSLIPFSFLAWHQTFDFDKNKRWKHRFEKVILFTHMFVVFLYLILVFLLNKNL